MGLTDPKVFTPQELQWLQIMLQQISEDQGDPSTYPKRSLILDFLTRVRASMQGAGPVVLTEQENVFFQNLVETWREGPGEYQFQGPYGTQDHEGGQFPDSAGIDTYYGAGLAGPGYKPGYMQTGANLIDDILYKLRH